MHSCERTPYTHDTTEGDDEDDDCDGWSWLVQVERKSSDLSRPELSSRVSASRNRDPTFLPVPFFFIAVARQDSARGLPPIKMSDEGFDPCECMWNYMSMQHLLSILRQSQDYCSDTECFSITRFPGPQPNVRESSDFFFTFLIIGFIVLMYAFRPRSLRQSTRNVIKNNNEPGSHEDGPPSPPTMN